MEEYSNNSNKTIIIIAIVIVVLASAVGGWYLFSYKPAQEAEEQARLAQIAQQQAEQKRKEELAERKTRYDQLVADADAAFGQENWQSAQLLYNEASGLFPNEQYPKDQLAIVNARLDELAAIEARKAAGIVETLTSPTDRFYVIISSSIDSDLANDYASKLAKEGTSVKIIEHTVNKLPFFGVSVADYATWDEANNAISSYSSFGEGIWVLKY